MYLLQFLLLSRNTVSTAVVIFAGDLSWSCLASLCINYFNSILYNIKSSPAIILDAIIRSTSRKLSRWTVIWDDANVHVAEFPKSHNDLDDGSTNWKHPSCWIEVFLYHIEWENDAKYTVHHYNDALISLGLA